MVTTLLEKKIARVRLLRNVLEELGAVHGKAVASRLGGLKTTCLIDHDPRWQAQLTQDCEIAYSRTSETVVREVIRAAPGKLMLELKICGQSRLIAHFVGEDVEIYLIKPGVWFDWFGIDNGNDTIPILPAMFSDPREPQWRAFLASPDGQWPRPAGA
jgi:hypothetical protein